MVQAEQPMHFWRSMTMIHLRWSMGFSIAFFSSSCMRRISDFLVTPSAAREIDGTVPGLMSITSGRSVGRTGAEIVSTAAPAPRSACASPKNLERQTAGSPGKSLGRFLPLARSTPVWARAPPAASAGRPLASFRRNLRRLLRAAISASSAVPSGESCISSQSTLDRRPCSVCRGELRVVPGSHHGKTMMAGGTLVRRAAEEAVGDGVANELSPPPQAKLLHDVRPVRFDRVDADVQLVGDLLAGVP